MNAWMLLMMVAMLPACILHQHAFKSQVPAPVVAALAARVRSECRGVRSSRTEILTREDCRLLSIVTRKLTDANATNCGPKMIVDRATGSWPCSKMSKHAKSSGYRRDDAHENRSPHPRSAMVDAVPRTAPPRARITSRVAAARRFATASS